MIDILLFALTAQICANFATVATPKINRYNIKAIF